MMLSEPIEPLSKLIEDKPDKKKKRCSVGERESDRERAGIAFHCVNVINARSKDRP